jgi:hypothetical protein
MLGSTAMIGLRSSFRQTSRSIHKVSNPLLFKEFSPDLQDLILDMTGLAWLLNDISAGRRQKLNYYIFHDTCILLGYRLVYICPLGDVGPGHCLEKVAHLGLTAFLMTFLRRLDHKISEMPLISQLARVAAQEEFDNDKETQEVLLWFLFIGKTSIFKKSDDIWLLPRVARTMQALGLGAWEDVRRMLARWPWVNTLHDKAGWVLCQS